MAKVRLLTKEVAELIAAGEVIERPSSIIKELVENSIDSGAGSITVEIKRGGVTFMRVTDNGCGISEDDVPTAFLRHATSKLSSKEDLSKILTLGFRGEALASIAAVSKVEMLTKASDDKYGTHYVIEGTEQKLLEKSGCPDGTTIIIRDIFYNVPARLKFLKKDVTEGNAVSTIINKIALSHPEVSIKFIRDNKQELFTPGDGDLYSTVYSVFGKQIACSMIPVNYDFNGIKVSGYTVKPLFGRQNRAFQNYFVNGRYVKSVTCTIALEEAYQNSMMTGKFPACVLKLDIAPEIVDVNVHPAKIEVRFTNEKVIFDSVYFAVKNALMLDTKPAEMELAEIPEPVKPKINYNVPVQETLPQYTQTTIDSVQNVVSAQQNDIVSTNTANASSEKEQTVERVRNDEYRKSHTYISEPCEDQENSAEKIVPIEDIVPQQEIKSDFKFLSQSSFEKKPEQHIENPQNKAVKNDTKREIESRIIGEAFKNFAIAECDNEVIFIDKHAAHERILFEKIKSGNQKLCCQMLLEPFDVLLSNDEYNSLSDNIEVARELGFSVNLKEHLFVEVRGIPSIIDNLDAEDIIVELAKNLSENKNNPLPEIIDDMYHSIACKSAIKANDTNSLYELSALVNTVLNDEKIRYCPHGRPVMFRLTKRELEKQFKRIV